MSLKNTLNITLLWDASFFSVKMSSVLFYNLFFISNNLICSQNYHTPWHSLPSKKGKVYLWNGGDFFFFYTSSLTFFSKSKWNCLSSTKKWILTFYLTWLIFILYEIFAIDSYLNRRSVGLCHEEITVGGILEMFSCRKRHWCWIYSPLSGFYYSIGTQLLAFWCTITFPGISRANCARCFQSLLVGFHNKNEPI